MPERTETEPELLAHHYTEAGLAAQAIDYWLRAGRRSAERSANIEAIGHLNRGLELLRTLPETIERARRELALQVALTGPLVASKGYAATEAAAAAIRARELCEQLGDVDRLPQVLYAEVGMLYVAAEDFRRVWPVVERFATVTEGLPGSGAQLVGRRFVALRHFHRGEFRQARDQVQGTLELFDPIRHDAIAFQYGHDEVVIERAYLSWVLWLLGFPDQAVEWSRAAAARGSEIKHTNSKAIALCLGLAMPQQFLRNPVAVREYSQSALEYSNEMKLSLLHALGEILAGWSRVELQRAEDGLVQMYNGFAEFRATGSGFHVPYLLGRLAEAQAKLGQIEEGRQTVERALAIVERSGDQSWESDLHRLKGDLLLSLSRREEAENSLASALAIARKQEARSLELRASLSLARLWCEERKCAQARALLQPVYDWFTEGFDTPDLRDARTLLQQIC
jgi:predicted ATPase